MPKYDAVQFRPPAPVAMVTVKSPNAAEVVRDVPMLIDSGADVSLLPRVVVAHLVDEPESLPEFELCAFDGSTSTAPAANLEVYFLGKSFRGEFLLVGGNYGILGRNILNCVSLHFDGPSLEWNEKR